MEKVEDPRREQMVPPTAGMVEAMDEDATSQYAEELTRALEMIADKVPSEVALKLSRVVERMGHKDTNSDSGKSKDDDDDDKDKRIRLSQQQAIEIFMLRPQPSEDGVMRRGSMLHCKSIAPRFNVTPKTIRDIWNGRTWSHATRHLWTRWEKQRRSFFLQDECGDARSGMEQDGGMGGANMSSMMVDHSMMGGGGHSSGSNNPGGNDGLMLSRDGAGAMGGMAGVGAARGGGGLSGSGAGDVSMGGLTQQTLGTPQAFWPFVSGHMGPAGVAGMGGLTHGGNMSSQDSHMQAMTHFLQMQQHAHSMSHAGNYGMPGGGYPSAFQGGNLHRPDISSMAGLRQESGGAAPGGDGRGAGAGHYNLGQQQQSQQE
eukprot:CAMPEP_0173379908 /NCGR_PEP_ID=MMETSP1356-20130122/2700_1 /TAXON_ID=77927 ORGANISM="Hemiselmis virescens, Strain PCC157" /NCGR_SAMPLE_ID=MMETSP1356 /ASSEMBLY_ACC=CAM_ASM_000847 /LENGTH=371 /DNA_ID=CAMNT_0014333345 /DNA_START=57 /DNA_END=1172 /DNA_ORIENTATION=-